jgi:hypothetical protein
VTTDWPVFTGWLLSHGPLVAGLAAFAVSPGAHAVIAALLERRLLDPRHEFTAVAIGDPLLALAVGIGVALSPQGVNAGVRPVVLGAAGVLIPFGWLGFGLWQWRAEVRDGFYTRAQAFAPTKIWHQFGVYPLLGSACYAAVFSGLAAPLGHPATTRVLAKVTICVAVAVWGLANVYDRQHPKLGHPPYDWHRLRPLAPPWPRTSRTLQNSATAGEQRSLRSDLRSPPATAIPTRPAPDRRLRARYQGLRGIGRSRFRGRRAANLCIDMAA